jgi:hypothetical protein
MEFEFISIKSKVQIEGVSCNAAFTKHMYDKSITELIVMKCNETNFEYYLCTLNRFTEEGVELLNGQPVSMP